MNKQELSRDEIRRLSSVYIAEGIQKDSWEITAVTINDKHLSAAVRMASYAVSPTDAGGFHLSIFTATEFVSQLNVIYLHHWAGYREKTLECWMIEMSASIAAVIRDPDKLRVELDVRAIRKLHGRIYIESVARVSDGSGTFEVKTKAMASL